MQSQGIENFTILLHLTYSFQQNTEKTLPLQSGFSLFYVFRKKKLRDCVTVSQETKNPGISVTNCCLLDFVDAVCVAEYSLFHICLAT